MKKLAIAIFCALAAAALAGAAEPAGGAAPPAAPPAPDAAEFIGVDGTRFTAPGGGVWIGRGVAFGNAVWSNPTSPAAFSHHRMEDYKRLREMGFNSVRFYMNYGMFDPAGAGGNYRAEAFDWLDRNIAAAKAQGVRLVLNMHYPYGGFQSNGAGDALWTDRRNQDKLVALWTAIAARYRAEPTVWGYGAVNEPVPVHGLAEWQSLAQRIVDAIRSVDGLHVIFVERAIWLKSGAGPQADAEFCFPPTLADPAKRLALEFHFYEPMPFTHQNTSWTGYKGQFASYPDDDRMVLSGARWSGLAQAGAPMPSGDFDWREAGGTDIHPRGDEGLVAYPTFQAQAIGASGRVWLESVKLEEIAADGTARTLRVWPGDSEAGWYYWSQDGSGGHALARTGHGGALAITGTRSDANLSWQGGGVALKPKATYRLSGRIKGMGVAAGATVRLRLDYHAGTGLARWNRAYLDGLVGEYAAYAAKRNLPLYLGEFGVVRDAFQADRGGAVWADDMLGILEARGISYNYHDWKESAFGIHGNDVGYADPALLNQALVDVLKRHQLR